MQRVYDEDGWEHSCAVLERARAVVRAMDAHAATEVTKQARATDKKERRKQREREKKRRLHDRLAAEAAARHDGRETAGEGRGGTARRSRDGAAPRAAAADHAAVSQFHSQALEPDSEREARAVV